MPNDCFNKLTVIDGSCFQLSQYLKKNDQGNANELFGPDFNKVIPVPEGYYENGMWYNWCVENWGTKWNSYNGETYEDHIIFDTAWSPPLPVIVELAIKTGLKLRLVYDEPGMCFCGELIASPDGTYLDNYYQYHTNFKTVPMKLSKELGHRRGRAKKDEV